MFFLWDTLKLCFFECMHGNSTQARSQLRTCCQLVGLTTLGSDACRFSNTTYMYLSRSSSVAELVDEHYMTGIQRWLLSLVHYHVGLSTLPVCSRLSLSHVSPNRFVQGSRARQTWETWSSCFGGSDIQPKRDHLGFVCTPGKA